MCVPLLARRRTLGAITFVAAESGRHYGESDLRFAEDVASRAALAVENARAYDEARRANRLKDDFLATLSHELRTPLNAILGYARMLRSGVLTGTKHARGLEIVERSATSLTQIVDDVLDVSRIVSGKIRLNVQPVELPIIVNDAVATILPAADARRIAVHTTIDPDIGRVSGDPDRLQQVVWNLLTNAVKFTPPDGRVEVRVEVVESQAEIMVRDTGIGFPKAFAPHLFERFRQAHGGFDREHGGLGLGLAIAQQLVEMHGGTIEAASEGKDQGATFRVRLPLLAARVEPPDDRVAAFREPVRPSAGGVADLDGLHVLAVDDDADALTLVREILEGAGARVTTSTSAPAALDVVAGEHPDVLIADLGMPLMDGFELIARVRQSSDAATREMPAAALTAYARPEDRARALRHGFQMHLAKPIDPATLIAAVAALGGPRSTATSATP
jgi:signal transduction histidine kinase/CheY-like chemotaxis protein